MSGWDLAATADVLSVAADVLSAAANPLYGLKSEFIDLCAPSIAIIGRRDCANKPVGGVIATYLASEVFL